jgi:hypothetical protein
MPLKGAPLLPPCAPSYLLSATHIAKLITIVNPNKNKPRLNQACFFLFGLILISGFSPNKNTGIAKITKVEKKIINSNPKLCEAINSVNFANPKIPIIHPMKNGDKNINAFQRGIFLMGINKDLISITK